MFALLADAGLLAGEATKVVELRTANVTARNDLDLLDRRSVNREDTLDADAERDLADAEGFLDAAALASDDVALEHLDTRAVTFNNLHVHLDVVASAEIGNVALEVRRIEFIELLHKFSPASRPGSDGECFTPWRRVKPTEGVYESFTCAGPLAAIPVATDLPCCLVPQPPEAGHGATRTVIHFATAPRGTQ